MRKPIHSDQKIIESGEALMAKLGREISATDIHKALGGKGKFSRIRDIWDAHMAAREEELHQDEIPLPEGVEAQITSAVTALERSMKTLAQDLIARMTEQSVRQFALRERDFALVEAEHARKVQALEAEIDYLTQCLDDLEAEEELSETEVREPEQLVAQAAAPAAVALAEARKSPNRPVKKNHPAPRKAVRPAPSKPTPAPKPEQTPS